MAKTYAQLAQEIDALKLKAESVRKKELSVAIAGMKAAIAYYGLSAADLGLATLKNGGTAKPMASSLKGNVGAPPSKGAVKYRDNNGNAWSGMGPRPRWLKAALAAGQSIETFAVDGAAVKEPAMSTKRAKSVTKTKLPAKYKDDAGNAWSGRGSTPRWIKAALESGKTLAQLAV
jgi:DNA-binding protein H-NS